MAQRAYGGDFQQESSVRMTVWEDVGLADREQKRYGDLQNSGQITRQDSTNSKEAKSVGGSRGEYLKGPATNEY